jgi:hypothetical protein
VVGARRHDPPLVPQGIPTRDFSHALLAKPLVQNLIHCARLISLSISLLLFSSLYLSPFLLSLPLLSSRARWQPVQEFVVRQALHADMRKSAREDQRLVTPPFPSQLVNLPFPATLQHSPSHLGPAREQVSLKCIVRSCGLSPAQLLELCITYH